MAAEPIGVLVERLADRARSDDALAETLAFLADDDADGDPFARPSDAVLAAVRQVNTRRASERRRGLKGDALTTAQVVALIETISDRRGVDRRRHRGRLLGVKVGATVWHPAWQFDRQRGDTRAGLARVLEALAEITDDPAAANELMMAPRPDLGVQAIADVFADGDIELVTTLIGLAGDQS